MALDGTTQAASIRLRFTTRENDLQLGDNAAVLIPTAFRRYQLSQYVNSQLELGQPVPFEFLINGSYLRRSLEDYLTENGISAENTLTVEYVRARIPPPIRGELPTRRLGQQRPYEQIVEQRRPTDLDSKLRRADKSMECFLAAAGHVGAGCRWRPLVIRQVSAVRHAYPDCFSEF